MTKHELVHSILIQAPRAKVWAALTTSGMRQRFWHDTVYEGDLRVGGRVRWREPDGPRVYLVGTILELVPQERIVHTFRFTYGKDPASRVTFTFADEAGGTRLTIVHDRLEQSPTTRKQVRLGWIFIFRNLKRWLERGRLPWRAHVVGALFRLIRFCKPLPVQPPGGMEP